MTTFQAALIEEQGVKFAVVSVKDSVAEIPNEANAAIREMEFVFRCPVVVMGAHRHRLYGRRDLVNFLSHVHPARLPWQQWNLAA